MGVSLSRESVEGLRAQFSGEVVGPDDGGYDERGLCTTVSSTSVRR